MFISHDQYFFHFQETLLRKTALNGSGGEPASTEDNFLRRKEAQLKERRAQQRASQNVSSTSTPSPTATEKTTKDIKLKASTVLGRSRQDAPVAHAFPAQNVAQDVHIEPFYFPTGKPPSLSEVDITVQRIRDVFSKLEGGKVDLGHMKDVVKVIVNLSHLLGNKHCDESRVCILYKFYLLTVHVRLTCCSLPTLGGA